MIYDDVSPIGRAFVGTFVLLRALGFPAADIFLEIGESARFRVLSVFATLKTQNKEFSIELGAVEGGETGAEALSAEYNRLAAGRSTLSQEDLDRMMNESEAGRKKVSLISALLAKGIRIPGDRS